VLSSQKCPVFLFSSYSAVASLQPVIIRMDTYQRLLADAYAFANASLTPAKPLKQKLMVRVDPNASSDERADVINGLRTFFTSSAVFVLDTNDILTQSKQAIDMMNLFFTIVGVLAMVVCFFILWLSFTANVRENAWEFGVLRAIGVNSTQVVMIYIYEALALVLTSLILGTIIGIVTAATLTLQFDLFTEMLFVMEFPYTLFFVMFGMAIGVAVLGSYVPGRDFLHKSISNVLRRN